MPRLIATLIALVSTLSLAQQLVPDVSRDRPFGELVGLGVKFGQGQPLKDLPMLKELGVRWVRDHASWAAVEPVAGQFDFPEPFKQRLAFYRGNDIGVCFCLAYDNKKAYPPTPESPNRNIDPEAFGRYAAAVAKMLREAKVRFVLEVWNEPHNFVLRKQLGGQWHGGASSPWLDHYLKMLAEAVKQVKAVDPAIPVLSDEDCTIIHYRLLEAGLPKEVDGFAFHPYMSKKVTFPEATKEGRGADWEKPFTLADADHSFRSMVRRLREQGQAKLGKTPDLWITEFGCPVKQDVKENVTFELGSGTEDEVSAILPRAFIGAEAAGVKAMLWFSSWDGPDGPMGLVAKNGQKRKTYTAFKTMSGQLGAFTLASQPVGRSHLTGGPQAYLFRKGEEAKVVVWQIDGPPRKLALAGALKEAQVVSVQGEMQTVAPDAAGVRQLELGTSPVYLTGLRDGEYLRRALAALE